MYDDVRARPGIRTCRPIPSSSSIAWWSTATGLCTIFVATLVVVVCPAIRVAAPTPMFSSVDDSSFAAVATATATTDTTADVVTTSCTAGGHAVAYTSSGKFGFC